MASAARRWSSSLEWPAAPPAGGGGGRGPLAPPSVSFGHARGEGSMKVEWRREPNSRAVLDVELPPEEVSRAVEAAPRRLAQRVAIPGFRRGKAPRAILERYVGRESLIDETLKLLLPDGYTRAVQEAGLAPIGQPEIDLQTEGGGEDAPPRLTAAGGAAPQAPPGGGASSAPSRGGIAGRRSALWRWTSSGANCRRWTSRLRSRWARRQWRRCGRSCASACRPKSRRAPPAPTTARGR